MRPWKLAEITYATVKSNDYEVAVLPIGATEPHNLHLPYSIDTIEGEAIGDRICEEAHARGAKVMLLPTIPYSTETNQRECPFSMNVNPSTLYLYLQDLIESLVYQGIRKIVLLNCHGGNDLKGFVREMYGKSEAKLFLCDWYRIFGDVYFDIFERMDDHAGEMETSLAMAICPHLVARNEDGSFAADDGQTRPTRFDAVNSGWVSITRPWHLLTTNTGTANPHAATAEKGERLLAILADRLAGFLLELSRAEIDDKFPF